MSPMERAHGGELMDEPLQDAAELARSLRDIRGVNRWLGGTRVMIRHVASMARRLPARPLHILDVATGSADIPLALARWGRRKGVRLQVVATDLHPQTLAVARERTAADPDVQVEEADALALPFGEGAFDLVLCNTALHHFDEEDAVRVLREMDRVARHGVVVSDLRRTRTGLLGARLLAATFWRNHPITRHDGVLSVRRAFTPAELRRLAAAAGLEGARVRAPSFFRLSLVAER
jgi:ubiquinone/menaquinone biosynthesis C-methylase UbiE